MIDCSDLPGADWILRGVAELGQGYPTPEAYCVAGATGLLRSLGFELPSPGVLPKDPEILFYESLSGRTDDPYGRYNAMRRELDSFATAFRRRLARN